MSSVSPHSDTHIRHTTPTKIKQLAHLFQRIAICVCRFCGRVYHLAVKKVSFFSIYYIIHGKIFLKRTWPSPRIVTLWSSCFWFEWQRFLRVFIWLWRCTLIYMHAFLSLLCECVYVHLYAFFSLTFHFVFKQPRRMIYLQMVNVYCSLMLSLSFFRVSVCWINNARLHAFTHKQISVAQCRIHYDGRKKWKKNEHMHTKTFPSDKWSVHFKRPPAVKIWVQYRMTFDFATFCF